MKEALALIGRIGCNRLNSLLDNDDNEHGVARFVLHGLDVEEVAAISSAVSLSQEITNRVEISLPRYKMANVDGINEQWLTDKTTTELRTAPCKKTARLFALFDTSQAQSLAQVIKINRDFLINPGLAEIWLKEATIGIENDLTESMKKQWVAAIKGMFQTDRLSLRSAARWLCLTRELIIAGDPIRKAIGKSLWVLRLPSFANAFQSIPDHKQNYPSEWRRKIDSHWSNECYLLKRNRQQIPYTRQALQDAFEKHNDFFREQLKEAIVSFISDGDGWTESAQELAQFDWEEVRVFFEGANKADNETLGERTKYHFGLLDPDLLLLADRDYIEVLVGRGAKPVKNEEDEQFYFSHRMDLQRDNSLLARWERFIFGTEVSCTDFASGILECIRRLLPERSNISGNVVLEVSAEESEKIKFKQKNETACRYFQARYSGLQHILDGIVDFRKLLVFNYDDIYSDLKNSKGFNPTSTAKQALQLTFRLTLRSADNDSVKTSTVKLHWVFLGNSVLTGFYKDISRLNAFKSKGKHSPFVRCQTGRETATSYSVALSLSNVAGFAPGRSDRGAFIPAVSKCYDLNKDWQDAINLCSTKRYIHNKIRDNIEQTYREFSLQYSLALDAMDGGDITCLAISKQAEYYGELLHIISTEITADEGRQLLLRPLLEIGVAAVGDGTGNEPVAVVCPWHPLRLYSTMAKFQRFKHNTILLLENPIQYFSDASGELYFSEVLEMLRDPGSPETVLELKNSTPRLLAITDSLHEYTLHELPTLGDAKSSRINDDPRYMASIVADIVDSYITLQPHERDNFSLILYNCDSAALPQAVVESVRATGSHEFHDAMCQIILTHSDRPRLQELYQEIASQDGEDEAFHVSESSKDFMARVRINIMVDEVPATKPESGQPIDIVFCHDVISRHADLKWARANRLMGTESPLDFQPHQWTRRREMHRGSRESIVYLACPAQTDIGWKYYLAMALLCEPEFALDSWHDGRSQLPARRLNFDKTETNKIFMQTHALGNWVVNYDELLDRRLLRDRDIKVIRYRQTNTQGRSLIISSRASDTLLNATIQNKLTPFIPADMLIKASEQFILDANEISGQIVLRAAKRGSSTNELLGLVLSAYLVKKELGDGRQGFSCFLLDDYATWLGQTEERIADLLILSPIITENGEKRLDIVITEAKFVLAGSASSKARESSKQLRDSLQRLERALLSTPTPIDQPIWLARISDLLLEGIIESDGESAFSVSEWRAAIRKREVKICLRGYSHIFVYGPADDGGEDKYSRVPQTQDGHQECFSRSTFTSILRSYLKMGEGNNDPTRLRRSIAGVDFATRSYLPIVSPASSPSALSTQTVSAIAIAHQELLHTIDAATTDLSVHSDQESVRLDHFQKYVDVVGIERAPQDNDANRWLEKTTRNMRVALQKRNMTAKLLDQRLTPNAALLKFQGTDDLTVAKVESRLGEFKTTDGLDVLSVRAELGKVAIYIARPRREILYLQDVWKRWDREHDSGNISLLIGVKEDDNELLFLSPEPQPHTLVAGWTGSGKSVLMQNIILSIASTNTPDQAQIILIDPKQAVDYFSFEGLPHFLVEPITNIDDSLEKLQWLVGEMKRRYVLFREERVPNIQQYIKKTNQAIPRLWVIHDEFAVWMQEESYRNNVASLVNQLSVEARASGIYLIFAAQRPDVTVLPMQLRSNLGNRLALRVDTEATSDIALGIRKGGAERLLGNGHLAALCGGASFPVYAQVPYIAEDDIENIVSQIRTLYNKPTA